MKYSKYNILRKTEEGNYILYNSVSKCSVEITEEYKNNYLSDEGLKNLSSEDYNFMYKNNIIVDDEKDELKELEYMFNSTYFRNDPLSIALVPSLKCNFSCPYCFEKVVQDKYENDGYFNNLKKYALKHFHNHSVVHLSLFGGEPLVKEKEMLDFLEFTKEDSIKNNYKMRCNITTNGSLLNENNVKKMLDCGLVSMQITLDGGEKTHNITRCFKGGQPSFDLLISKIKMVLELTKDDEDFIMIVRVNLNNNCSDDLVEILDRFTREECSRLTMLIRVVYNTDKYKETNSNSLDDLKKYYDIVLNKGAKISKGNYFYQPCEACTDSRFFYLMPDMTMWKCINDLNYKKAQFGKIDNEGNVKINFENLVNWYNAGNCFKDEACLKCKKLPDCFGGCVLKKMKTGKRVCKTFDMACLPYCMKDESDK